MHRPRHHCIAALTGLAGLLGAASAAAQPVTLRLSADIVAKTDGTLVNDAHIEIRGATDAAAQQNAQVPITFSPSMETVEILDSYTLKPDGRRVPVTAASIQAQAAPAAVSAPMYSDQQRRVVVFPEVAANDTVVLNTRRVVFKPQFPGHLQVQSVFPRTVPWEDVRLTLTAPSSMNLEADAVGLAATRSESSGLTTLSWHGGPFRATTTTVAVDRYATTPHVALALYPTWEALGRAVFDLFAPKMEVTPRVQALADEITQGESGRGRQAQKLYEWVGTNIRYVAVVLGNGGVEPHAADAVIANRYGDCKDQVVLFEALLRAKGIPSTPALINLGNRYDLPSVPSIVGLDHVITYIPELDLYADTAAIVAPFGTLAFQEYGKPVVLAGESGPALRRTPVTQRATNTTTLRGAATLTADGVVAGTTDTQSSGPFAFVLRSGARSTEGLGAVAMAARQLKAAGLTGTGRLEAAAPRDAATARAWGSYTLDKDDRIMDGGEFTPVPGMRMLVRPGDLLIGPLNMRDLPATEPTPCFAGHQIEELSLRLPAGRTVSRLPKDREVGGDGFRFTSRWTLDGDVLGVRREMVSDIAVPVCDGALRAQTFRALAEIRRAYAERVRLEEAP